MGSRGTLDRSSFRRVAGSRSLKPKALQRPVSQATFLDKADLGRLDDTSKARIVQVCSRTAVPNRRSGDEPGSDADDPVGLCLLVADIGGKAGTKTSGAGAALSSETSDVIPESRAAGIAKCDAAQGIFVSLRRKALEARLVALTRVPLRAPLVFESQVFFSSEAPAPINECLRDLLIGLKDGDDPERVAELEEALMTALLTCCKHNYSLRFQPQTGARLPRHVKLVEDYILENAEKPISMKDLEGITEVSARSIHHAFRRFRGYSPKALLQAVRLDRAHQSLLTADPGERVMTIAASCGFAHLGRFSAAYKKRFGELPSQTLGRK